MESERNTNVIDIKRCEGTPPDRRGYVYQRRRWADHAQALIDGECTHLRVNAPGPEFNSARTCLIGAVKAKGRRAMTYVDSRGDLIVTLRSRRGAGSC